MLGVPRDVKRIVLLVVSICVAVTAALAATCIIPKADPIYQIAVRTAETAGIPARVTPGMRQ